MQKLVKGWEFARPREHITCVKVNRRGAELEPPMLNWAIVFLVISLVAGAFGLANISDLTRKISFVLFGLFFLGFLVLLGIALFVLEATEGVSLGTDFLFVALPSADARGASATGFDVVAR